MIKALLSCALLIVAGTGFAQEPSERAPAQGAAEAQTSASETTSSAEPSSDAVASEAAEPSGGGVKSMLGMSVLGNQEAPKSLVIVPWKSSEIGQGIGVSRALDTSARPVDKDVFTRELRYYRIRASAE